MTKVVELLLTLGLGSIDGLTNEKTVLQSVIQSELKLWDVMSNQTASMVIVQNYKVSETWTLALHNEHICTPVCSAVFKGC